MKIKLTIFAIILVLFVLTGCCFSSGGSSTTAKTTITEGTTAETTTQPASEKGEYNIGDTGPAGGLIFYVNPDYITDGWRYLEAAPSDQSTEIQWCDGSDVTTGVEATVVGTGQVNTQTIVNIRGPGSYAAKLCNDLTQGGYSDWFLPSKDELNKIYENLYLNGVGGFAESYYWSSSELDTDYAWYQYFLNGGQYHNFFKKYHKLYVRAVRAFPASTPKPIVNSVNLLANPGFERGSENRPEGWTTTGWKPGKFLWDSTVAHSGLYSVKIDAPQANDLQWIQQVNVLPNSQYRFTAWVRTLDVGHSLEAYDFGANLNVDETYSWSENLKGTNDWTLLSLDIVTGPGDSALTFSLRLGGTCGTNTGVVWFDDAFLELVEDDVYAVFEGQHITLMLFKSDAGMISDIPGWLRQMDMAYELLEELVGSTPYDGEKITVREVPPCWFGGLAGNPILINQQVLQIEKFNNPNDLDFGVIHELAHDFDIPPYSGFYIGDGAINAEGWSNLKVVYVADRMATLFPEATFWGDGSAYLIGETGSNFEKKYAQPYLQAGRLDGLQMNNDVLTGLIYSLKRQIGWEPFKATFRDYQTYNVKNPPVSNSTDKINLFVTLLSKNSGVDLAPAFRSWGFDIK